MNTNQLETPKMPKNIKTWIHVVSLSPIPLLFLCALPNMIQDLGNDFDPVGGLFGIGVAIGYFAFLYYVAGGFDWQQERLSAIRGLLFFILSGFVAGLLLYAYWFIVRYFIAMVTKLPYSDIKGKLLTR